MKTGSGNIHFLLSVPPEIAQDRFVHILSVYNIVHALILSGALQLGCSPLNVSDYPEGRAAFVHAYNILAVILVTLSGWNTSTSVWALANVASQTEKTIMRTILYSSGKAWVMAVEGISAIETVIMMALLAVSQWLHAPVTVAAVTTAIIVTLTLCVANVYSHWALEAFPHTQWGFGAERPDMLQSLGKCHPSFKRWRATAEAVGGELADVAERRLKAHMPGHVPGGLLAGQRVGRPEPERQLAGLSHAKGSDVGGGSSTLMHAWRAGDGDGGASGGGGSEDRGALPNEASSQTDELAELLARALPHAQASSEANVALTRALLQEGITLAVLRGAGAAKLDVCAALSAVRGLRTGDRLAIATAVAVP